MFFYDTHAHLDYPDFAQDLPQVLERAADVGISKIISIGTDLESSRRAIELSQKHANVYAAVGWHPCDASRAPTDVRSELRALALQPKVVAIGETGLDYHRLPSEKSEGSAEDDARYKRKQQEIFEQQLELAAELGLNCVVHQRDSFEDTLAAVQRYAGRLRAVFHCFANGPADMQRVLETRSLVSFTGIVSFKNAQLVQEALRATPLDCFMLETDSPFLAPVPYRGKRCEPAYVRHTAEAVAQIKSVSLEQLSRVTCDTAHEFFRGLAGYPLAQRREG
jgi:TatD DNase family protein